VLGVDGISDFNALRSRQHDEEVQLYAFDILAYNGDDLTRLPLHLLKTNLEPLLRGRSDGIFVAPFEHGKIGPDLFEAACRMGLEGLVSKHRERPYRAGRCDHWLKVKVASRLQSRCGPVLMPKVRTYTGTDSESPERPEHFGNCPTCGALVDMRDPAQVMAHMHGQKPLDLTGKPDPTCNRSARSAHYNRTFWRRPG
jgi:hypothetical protein